jgi:hypothetical protein
MHVLEGVEENGKHPGTVVLYVRDRPAAEREIVGAHRSWLRGHGE